MDSIIHFITTACFDKIIHTGLTDLVSMAFLLKASAVSALTHPTPTLTPGQNDGHFADDIFKCIFVNEKFFISIRISLFLRVQLANKTSLF